MKLTVGYGRVSTEEQAAEGFSIEGQAEKLRAYAKLHDLGPLTFIDDPGLSGKNLDRPGLQQILALANDALHDGQWLPGRHEPVIALEEFEATHRGFRKGKRRGKDTLSGHVRCGKCSRAMSIDQNGQGHTMYNCAHRGGGCAQPRRSSKGLLRAALLGLRLVGSDENLQRAIRRELDGARLGARQVGSRARQRTTKALGDLTERRRKLLELYYADHISADLFAAEEQHLAHQITALRAEQVEIEDTVAIKDELGRRFESVLATFEQLDFERVWEAATDQERRVLIEELLEAVTVYPDHLEVAVHGAPKINVLLGEVGLVDQSVFAGVGGGT